MRARKEAPTGSQRGWLLERMRRRGRDARAGVSADGGQEENPATAEERECLLDWQDVITRLDPVRRRWDLAILANLREDPGRRPADLLAAINGQAGARPQLSPQVLSGRLRRLEEDGYVRHAEISRIPRRRNYWLLPRGRRLIEDLNALGSWDDAQEPCGRAGAAGMAPP